MKPKPEMKEYTLVVNDELFSYSGAIHIHTVLFFSLNWFNLFVIVAKITYVSTFL